MGQSWREDPRYGIRLRHQGTLEFGSPVTQHSHPSKSQLTQCKHNSSINTQWCVQTGIIHNTHETGHATELQHWNPLPSHSMAIAYAHKMRVFLSKHAKREISTQRLQSIDKRVCVRSKMNLPNAPLAQCTYSNCTIHLTGIFMHARITWHEWSNASFLRTPYIITLQ